MIAGRERMNRIVSSDFGIAIGRLKTWEITA
jgi:hypothetical protein